MKKHLLLAVTCAAGVLASAATASAQSNYEPYSFRTVAGLARNAGSDDSSAARFSQPLGVATDSAGNVYVADAGNHTIRKVTPDGLVTTLAGLAGSYGFADGTGSAARFYRPFGVATDSAGNVYVADSFDTIRKVTPGGVVTTLAGLAGNPGSADGTGSAARFSQPGAVATDSAGNVYVADTSNDTIRKVTPGGVVTTLAGLAGSRGSADGTGSDARFAAPRGVATDSAGNVYVGELINNTIRKVTPGGVVTTLAGFAGTGGYGSADGTGSDARFANPQGVATDSTGNVYVADSSNHTIRKVTPGGVVTTLAGLADGDGGDADGTGSAARFYYPRDVATDSAGNVYVADSGNNTIRKVTPDGVVTTLAGLAGGTGSADGTGRFFNPTGVATDSAGNVYVADLENHTIRKVTSGGVVTTLAGLAGNPGSDDGTGSEARFYNPLGVATDSAGNVYVADAKNNTIRMVTPDGVVTTLAGQAGSPGSADGTGSAARFGGPSGVATDSAGNVYVADAGNHTIRKVTPDGLVTTLAGLAGQQGSADGTGSAARFYSPSGVATDSVGNVYVADGGNNTIRKVTPGGVVTTLAGLAGSSGSADGTGSAARFNYPWGVATDSAGNVYVGDAGNHTIRKVTRDGVVTTLAGLAGRYGSADGTGSAARFYYPYGVATDSAGNVYVADFDNFTIRAGTPTVNNVPTPVGSNVAVDGGTLASTGINLTFSQVTTAGTTSLSSIDPATAGSLPTGYQIAGADLAFEISTTAGYTPPVTIAFHVPSVDDATFAQLRVLHSENGILVDRTATTPAPDAVNKIIYASTPSLSPFVLAKRIYSAKIQSPINGNGSSVFKVTKGGVVPVKFTLALGGAATCTLPAATIAVSRTAAGTTGSVNEAVYRLAADTGPNFRVRRCRYIYNLSSTSLGVGTYQAEIKIDGQAVGSCAFQLKLK